MTGKSKNAKKIKRQTNRKKSNSRFVAGCQLRRHFAVSEAFRENVKDKQVERKIGEMVEKEENRERGRLRKESRRVSTKDTQKIQVKKVAAGHVYFIKTQKFSHFGPLTLATIWLLKILSTLENFRSIKLNSLYQVFLKATSS